MIEFTDSTTGHIVIAKSRAVGLSNLDETREWDRVMEEIRRLVRSMEDREGMARALRVARAIAKMGASLREAAPLARWRAPPGSTGALLGSPGFRPWPPAWLARRQAGVRQSVPARSRRRRRAWER